MKKISNKGFVLAETIIVAVFMVTIFTVLYSNYFPIMANFEKREYYDDVDSKYIAFWLKYMIQDSSFRTNPGLPDANGQTAFSCGNITNSTKQKTCISLVRESGLSTNPYCNGASNCVNTGNLDYVAYIVGVNDQGISHFKDVVNDTNSVIGANLSDGFIDYINSLPDYKSKQGTYRLIIELYDNKVTGRKPIYKYASIEVKR